MIAGDSTIIPGKVKAQISLRVVPNQDLEAIVTSVVTFLKRTFGGFGSPNKLQVCVSVVQQE
jgi:di- and tripeptidase